MQESIWSDLCSEKTVPRHTSLLFHSISSLLLNNVFYLVVVTSLHGGKRKAHRRESVLNWGWGDAVNNKKADSFLYFCMLHEIL